MTPLRRTLVALSLAGMLLLTGCSGDDAAGPRKKPENVSTAPEALEPAPTAVVEDSEWTELPQPVAAVFGDKVEKGKFQAFGAMKTTTVNVQLKSAADEKDVLRALGELTAFTPGDYSIILNVYAPGAEGKLKFHGYEWVPMMGTLVKKSSADADQGWDAAITAITDGSATQVGPESVKKMGTGELPLPLFQ